MKPILEPKKLKLTDFVFAGGLGWRESRRFVSRGEFVGRDLVRGAAESFDKARSVESRDKNFPRIQRRRTISTVRSSAN